MESANLTVQEMRVYIAPMPASKPAPRPRGRPRKSERPNTRQDLLDAALKLFARQGYDATTVRQIADEVGIRDSAIYAHFRAKQELLDALIAESGIQLMDRLGFDFDELSGSPPSQVLPAFCEALVAGWGERRSRMLLGMLTREGLVRGADTVGSFEERFRPLFGQWVKAGHFRKGLRVDDLLSHFILPLAAIRLLFLNAHSSPAERQRGKDLAHRHVRHFLRTTQNR